ncbi:Fe-S cluster assembly protein SufD [Thioalkalivibrio sp. ALE17]|uniref:Fe-S cluster assembly protein SufD n=1 Tax=Thioalkalivibrio sp. ALE17 TaxID=1158173 RepID=UPI0003FFC356|nr:Fe-S cluster assembly protein SufD [Thioalkalivibrio sp. ALE17]
MSAISQEDHYTLQAEQLDDALPPHLPQWLLERRRVAARRFIETGFPDPRDEEWKYTNVRPLTNKAFAAAERRDSLDAATVAGHTHQGLEPIQLVFEDGHLRPDLSELGPLPAGVQIRGLNSAIHENPDELEPHLDAVAHDWFSPFPTLNTAFLTDGVLIHLARGVTLERPLQILLYGNAESEALWCHPRILIIAEEQAAATVIEHYVDAEGARGFTNVVTEIVAHAGAQIQHYLLQDHSDTAYHVGNVFVRQHRDSVVTSHNVNMGGRLVRHDLNIDLIEPGSEIHLNGLFLVSGRQHADTHTRVHHSVPHTRSREEYRGIAQGHGRGVFKGRVLIQEGAQKTEAEQHSANLLLSDKAEIDTKPELEIYADDVKAAHGATVGQLDAEALYYLASRGIPRETARAMLVHAFAEQVLDRIALEPVREAMRDRLSQRLPGTIEDSIGQ